MKLLITLLNICTFCLIVGCSNTNTFRVSTIDEFDNAEKRAKPGDIIELQNGVWRDCEFIFNAKGDSVNPIILKAEDNGKVIITGKSRLIIGGDYLTVEGLVFKDGSTPTNEVISFKYKKGKYANHCRLTECVIDNFNPDERFQSSTYVSLYGKRNRIDHCNFLDKRNLGVTFAVRMIDEACQENHHIIDHNYFGFRQNLGSNGGETLRIGTSHYSLNYSNTVVQNNYFESCDGEHEIISNKSCGNQFINNTFYECRGTLTFRHGNDNIAEGNFFLGNNKDYTGGIRIINKRNKAINNYFSDLKGYRFRGSLVIMNGVPNSAINRYHQVDGGVFANNTFINCDHIQLCAGSDEERSACPVNSEIRDNIFYHDSKDSIFTFYDNVDGISFENNYIGNNIVNLQNKFIPVEIQLSHNKYGINTPTVEGKTGVGCSLLFPVAMKDSTGVNWYPKATKKLVFDTGKVINVKPGQNTLWKALSLANDGDVIQLMETGNYFLNKKLNIKKTITFKAFNDSVKPIIISQNDEVFVIENNGALKLKGIEIEGIDAPDDSGNCIVSTSHCSMNRNYKFLMENCTVRNLNVNKKFDFFRCYKNTMADSVVITNCKFENITGDILLLDKEIDDLGRYNAEYVIIKKSEFKNIKGTSLNLYRGGSDESTFGPMLSISDCQFENVGSGTNTSISTHGVQVNSIHNIKMNACNYIDVFLTNGGPVTKITNVIFQNSKGLKYNIKPLVIKDIVIEES